ncbi:hypothetical protein VTO42DRAFT_2180 [Malbranchea cinnamomea]
MRIATLSTVLLSAAALALATETVVEEDYVPRPLNETVKALGLEEYVEDLPPLEKRDLTFRCHAACDILGIVLHSETQRPGSNAYTANKASYWAQQQSSISPECFIQVKSSLQIAIAITMSRLTQCPFAVRSGGHSDVPGASNIEGGITIDMSKLNEVSVSRDKSTVYIGAGAKWGDVYRTLDELELSVIGGRAASVGVGGLTLGGGMSYLSGREGFACDNVEAFKIMMADGIVLNVKYNNFPDLYWALRGGGNNFGVVLGFTFRTFELGKMWGGMRVYPINAKEAINQGLSSFNEDAAADKDLAVITSFMYLQGNYVSTVIFDYAKPEPDPAILTAHFGNLQNYPKVVDTTRITNLTDLAIELGGGTPNGFRNQFTTATYKNSAELQNRMVDFFMEEVENIKSKVSDISALKPVIAFQPIPTTITSHMSKNGGNPLGLSPADGPLLLVQFNWAWMSDQDDAVVLGAIDNILNRSNALATQMGLSNDYIYQNYAAPNQKPFASYGAENVKKLRKVQSKYDPCRVMERLQPGGFKLDQ